eukprot:TRINITY_DN1789_c0_g1_i4.p1 TRINITY_DN1789_c0_g1~~TRINITY_DN1789_c0_g1_i4.p1  ORF type:complete len:314 (-),score=110.46 TRINITY_DN1789_c0_g1_i4:68-886(-)
MWGVDGHSVTAQIAQEFLNQGAQAQVDYILANVSGQMDQVSSWADHVDHMQGYEWTGPPHYIDTADWQCYYNPLTDCPDQMCVAGAIYNYTDKLASPNTDNNTKEYAIRFVIHFHGDIHQPLHVAFKSNRGGNSINGYYDNQSTELHAVWDDSLIYTRLQDQFGNNLEKYVQYLIGLIKGEWKAQATSWSQCAPLTNGEVPLVCPDAWANETAAYACSNAYVDQNGNVIDPGFSLGDDYYNFNKDIIDLQLAKGGVRLASTLNKMWGDSTGF